MAGQQHPFPSGFQNPQQNAIRMQYGGGQMVSGLMGPQQNMMNPQQYGTGVGPNVGPVTNNALGILNAQMQQMQQQQMQMQQQQQQQPPQQPQPPQPNVVDQNQQVNEQVPQMPMPQVQATAQKQVNRDFNTASLCKLGQETVQDIVLRTQELFQNLKVIQPPNGIPQGNAMANDKKIKVQEQLRLLGMLFKRLRLIYERCNENCGMEYHHIESLIPVKEEWDMKSEERKTSESYRSTWEENKETIEQVILKNKQLKEMMDTMRRTILEINTMMNMRRS